MMNPKIETALQRTIPARLQRTTSARLRRAIPALVTCVILGSCSIHLMWHPPVEYVRVTLVPDGGTPGTEQNGTLNYVRCTLRNNSAKVIVWMELSFTLFDGDGAQLPAFGRNYFTTRVSCNVVPGETETLTTSLEPFVEPLSADAVIGLFFIRTVRFRDGTEWWNFGSYRYEEDES